MKQDMKQVGGGQKGSACALDEDLHSFPHSCKATCGQDVKLQPRPFSEISGGMAGVSLCRRPVHPMGDVTGRGARPNHPNVSTHSSVLEIGVTCTGLG